MSRTPDPALEKELLLADATEALEKTTRRVLRRQARDFTAFAKRYELAIDDHAQRLAQETIIPEGEWLAALEKAIAEGNEALLAAWEKIIASAMAIGGAAMIDELEAAATLSFNLDSPAAKRYLADEGGRFITRISDTTRRRVRKLMRSAFDEGVGWPGFAKQLREQFTQFGGRKPQRHIRDRAALIAITETGNAFEEAAKLTGDQLAEAGLVVEKYWRTSRDGKVSDGCKANEAAGWIDQSASFPSGHQRPLRFPGCRCTTKRRLAPDVEA